MIGNASTLRQVGLGAIAPSPPLLELLEACGLPTADLQAERKLYLYGAWLHDDLVGSVGIEPYGEVGLLRSLAVAPAQRSRRLGRELLAHAEREAQRAGVRELWLLTGAADRYFERHGYTVVEREQAPAAIRNTAQFSGLCPASAVMMAKSLS